MLNMTAYYNEIDPHAAQWLRNLIDAGEIAPGIVDERDIRDVKPSELAEFTQCHFFAGIGVWSYALRKAGWPDDRPVWTGSCPCQPFSQAGGRGGTSDERHLWPHWFHLIGECCPPVVFGEQVASKDGLGWLDLVQTDLEGAGYASGAVDTCAAGFGSPHIRQRLYFVADSGRQRMPGSVIVRGSGSLRQGGAFSAQDLRQIYDAPLVEASWPKPLLCEMDAWAPAWMDEVRAYGNALDACQAQAFIEAVMDTIDGP